MSEEAAALMKQDCSAAALASSKKAAHLWPMASRIDTLSYGETLVPSHPGLARAPLLAFFFPAAGSLLDRMFDTGISLLIFLLDLNVDCEYLEGRDVLSSSLVL